MEKEGVFMNPMALEGRKMIYMSVEEGERGLKGEKRRRTRRFPMGCA